MRLKGIRKVKTHDHHFPQKNTDKTVEVFLRERIMNINRLHSPN